MFVPSVYVEDIPLADRHPQLGLEVGGHLTVGHLDDDGWGPVFAVLAVRPGGPVDLDLERLVQEAEQLTDQDDSEQDAVAAWRAVLAHAPGHALAYHRLEVLLEQEENWATLVEVLRDRMGHQPDATRALTLQIAAVLEHDLGDTEQAITTYEGLLGANEADVDALEALARLYAEAGDWSSVVEIESSWLATLVTPRARSERLLSIARIARDQLDRPADAVSALREVIALVPDHAKAMDELAELHTQHEDWWPLVEVLTARALLPGAASGAIQLRLAALMENQLEDLPQAIRLYESALESGGDAPAALAALERLYIESSDWEHVVKTYERLLALATSEATRVDLLERLALVQEEALGDLEGAMLAWDRLLELTPDNQDAFGSLRRLQRMVGTD